MSCRVQVGGGAGLMKEKGRGVGRVWGGVGTGKGTGKSMCTRLSKLPFSKLPFSFSLISVALFLGAKSRER